MLFISHKLDEVEALCEDVLVLRSGRTVGRRKMAETDRAELIRMMVGENISSGLKRAEKFIGPPLFNLENISTAKLSVPSLQLKPGVITGIAGIAGNGQDALLNVLSGETATMPANVRFEGKNIGAWGVRRRNAAGILAVCRPNAITAPLSTICRLAKMRSLIAYRRLIHSMADSLIQKN